MNSLRQNDLNLDKSLWIPTRIGDLASDVNDRVANPAESEHDRFVGLEHFVSGDLKIKAWKTTEGLVSAAKAFKSGDILFARRNAYLKRASMVDFEGVCSGDAFVLRENNERVVPGYLAFVMNSKGLWRYAISNAAGTMSKRVKWRDLANYEFLLPPKDQQAKLAELLWAADAALESGLAVVRQADTARRAFIANYFAEKAERYVRLEDAADVRYGLTLNSKRSALPNRRPYLRVANVGRETIDLSEVKDIGCSDADLETFSLELNDVLVVEGHANIREIGRSAIWKGGTEGMLHQNHLIRVRCNDGLAPRFLSAYINSPRGQGYFQGIAKSTSGLNTINSTVVKDFKIPVIPEEEQNHFVQTLDSLESSQSLATKNHEGLRMVLKSLINQIF